MLKTVDHRPANDILNSNGNWNRRCRCLRPVLLYSVGMFVSRYSDTEEVFSFLVLSIDSFELS